MHANRHQGVKAHSGIHKAISLASVADMKVVFIWAKLHS